MRSILPSISYLLLPALCLATSPLAKAATTPTYIFNRTYTPMTGSSTPSAVGAGDFNGDKLADFVVAEPAVNKVYVFLGRSDGTFPPFSSAIASAAPANMVGLAVGDFNKDGKLDVVVISRSGTNTVSLMLGNGSGGFGAPATVFTGNNPKGVVAADFNNDGKLDLAVVEQGGNTVTCLLGDGKGHFTFAGDFATGSNPTALSAADFNGDGKLDLVVGSQGIVSVLPGNGDGTFQARNDTNVASGAPFAIGAGDFDKNGKQDVAVQFASAVYTLVGNGDGTFQPPVSHVVTSSNSGGIVIADLDGDGKLDIATAQGDPNILSILLGNGNGAFQSRLDYSLDVFGSGVAMLDSNGDGRPDLVAVGNASPPGASVLINTGKIGNPFSSRLDYVTGSGPEGADIADLRSRGRQDIVTANSSGNGKGNSISVLLDNGDGTFVAKQDFATCTAPWNVVIGDFNNDAKPDVVVSCRNNSGGISLLLGNGDGTFQTHKDFSAGSGSFRLVAGDFNKDGNLDIAVANGSGNSVSILLGDGNGSFSLKSTFSFNNPTGLVVADFDKNGALDLAVADPNAINMLLGNGDGTFTTKAQIPSGAASLGAFDLNDDGKLDLIGGGKVFLGNGDGTFQAGITTPLGNGPGLIALDLNQDGKLDAAVNQQSSTFQIALGNGDGTFQTPAPYQNGAADIDARAADLNGDGQDDLVLVNENSDNVTVYLATAVPAISPASLTFATQLLFTKSKTKTVTVGNPGTATLDIGTITFSISDFVTLTDKCSGAKVPAGGSCSFSVSFDPKAINTRTGTANFTANGITESVSLSGVGTEVKLVPTTLKFGSVPVGTSLTMTETLTNVGSNTLNINSIKISGAGAVDYQITSNGCDGSVAPNTSCNLGITFTPSVIGTRTAKMVFSDNGGGSPQSVKVTGSGT
jgi:hypothetical protein